MEQSNRNPISPLEIINLWPGNNLTIELIPQDGVTVIRQNNRDEDALLIIYQDFQSNFDEMSTFYIIDVGINEYRNLPNSQNIRSTLKDQFTKNSYQLPYTNPSGGIPKMLIAVVINRWLELVSQPEADARRQLDFSNLSYNMDADVPPPPRPIRLRRQNAQVVDADIPPPPLLRRQRAVVLDFPEPQEDPNAGVAVNLRAPNIDMRLPDEIDQEQPMQIFRQIKCDIVKQFRDQWNNQLHLLFHTSDQSQRIFEAIVSENAGRIYTAPEIQLNEIDRQVRRLLQTFVNYERLYFINVLENKENGVVEFNNMYGQQRGNCIGGENGVLLYEGNPGFVEFQQPEVMGFNFDSPTLVINGNTYREGFVYDKDNIEMRGLDNETLKNIAPGWNWVSKPGSESLNLMELTYKFNYKMGDDNVTQVTTRLTNRDD